MTPRQAIMNVLNRKNDGYVVWQPMLDHWYNVNKANGTLPEHYRNMTLPQIYKDLGACSRPYLQFEPFVKMAEGPNVQVNHWEEPGRRFTEWLTPIGSLSQEEIVTDYAHQLKVYPIKTPDDMHIFEYILNERVYSVDMDGFLQADAEIEESTIPIYYLPRVNWQEIIIYLMGFEAAVYALVDYKEEMESLIHALDRSDEVLCNELAKAPFPAVNYGDNIHQDTLPEPWFREYVIPAYARRNEIFSASGIKTFSHWDGDVKRLLHLLPELGIDGVEAVTPKPQGDVTLQELREALPRNMILLDGIPMTSFLPHEPLEELDRLTDEVIDLFSPNLLLGISDQLSPTCDIERVRRVSERLGCIDGIGKL